MQDKLTDCYIHLWGNLIDPYINTLCLSSLSLVTFNKKDWKCLMGPVRVSVLNVLSTYLWTDPILTDFYLTRTSFSELILHCLWYSWNLFFLQGYLTGPPSHGKNAGLWLSFLSVMASIPVFQHEKNEKEYF